MSRVVLLLLSLLLVPGGPTSAAGAADELWFPAGADGERQVVLYFFWSSRCPHCLEARPFVQALAERHPWLRLDSGEVLGSEESRARYQSLATLFGQEARSVPAFFFCGRMAVGYDGADRMGTQIEQALRTCHQTLVSAGPAAALAPAGDAQPQLEVPWFGALDLAALSLPLVTVVIGALDAFNPCAFFVLLFLLSLLVHARSRARMLFIGGVFVLFSGLIYFLFMAAWLNLFLFAGQMTWVTTVAGLVAVTMASVNIKDWFAFKRGVSLSIPEQAKPGLFRRMRELLHEARLPGLVLGTVTLAVVANSYELLCTSGLPMVYTRLLTLNELPTPAYYGYLALYNVVYVLPLLAIVLLFTWTLGARKLQEREGRLLKLLSGLMMLGLGLVLLFAPQALSNLMVAVSLLLGAVVLAASMAWLERRRNSHTGGPPDVR